MGLMQRNKGKKGEREAAHEITRLFGVEAHRGRQFQGGDDSPDIKTDIEGIHFEVKRTEKILLYAAMAQALEDASELEIPIVLHRKNNKKWLAVIQLDDLPDAVAILHDVLRRKELIEPTESVSP